MRKIREVLRLKHEQGLSHQAVAQACAVGVGTVNRYLQRAAQRGLGWPLPDDLDDAALEARLFPRAAPVHDRIRPDCAYIHRELKRDSVTLQLLWEEYAQIHPDGYGRTQFCEIYRQWTRRLRPSMRQVHRAGEKTFIDYSGKRPSLVDRRTGELRRVELFVAVLGASSLTYAAATETQQLPDWIDAHIRMVEYFGGATTLWVPDQLKSAITRPCRYEPGVNRTYEDLATHYGAVVVPARPRKPRDKAAVENCVLIAQRWILARLRDQTFFELGPLNAAIRVLLDELNDRPMKKLGVSRRALYEQVDRPALRSLPTARYVLAHWKLCRANIDYHVEVERHVYSVPFQLVREQVEVRYTTNTVEIFYRGKRLTSHRRRYDGQPSTHREHMPSAHRAHAASMDGSKPAICGRLKTGHFRRPETGVEIYFTASSVGKVFAGALALAVTPEASGQLDSLQYRQIQIADLLEQLRGRGPGRRFRQRVPPLPVLFLQLQERLHGVVPLLWPRSPVRWPTVPDPGFAGLAPLPVTCLPLGVGQRHTAMLHRYVTDQRGAVGRAIEAQAWRHPPLGCHRHRCTRAGWSATACAR